VSSLRFAYADPPYIGRSGYYDHVDRARWDDPAEHVALMRELDATFDGWALSCHEPSLAHLAAPAAELGARVAAWVKPFAAYKPNVRVAYTWEPVIWRRSAPRREGDPVGRDYLSAGITLQRGLVGAKPEAFAHWLLVLLGWQNGDELVDLFPGSGVVGRVADANRLAL